MWLMHLTLLIINVDDIQKKSVLVKVSARVSATMQAVPLILDCRFGVSVKNCIKYQIFDFFCSKPVARTLLQAYYKKNFKVLKCCPNFVFALGQCLEHDICVFGNLRFNISAIKRRFLLIFIAFVLLTNFGTYPGLTTRVRTSYG